MSKKRKGFTLLEAGVALVIFGLTLSIGTISYKYYEDYETLVTEKGFLNDIYSLINYGRKSCISEGMPGEILKDKKNNELIFRSRDKSGKEITQKLKIPNKIQFLKESLLKINSKGDLDATTIEWKGIEADNYKLTISVGINTIRVYINGKQETW